MSTALDSGAGQRVPLPTKLAYGFGAIAYGIKDNGFQVFLLLFYNQVVGLPADTVGLAIMAALFVDAFVDPAIGVLSDRTHSRWGRRHPWLYASAIPIALSWVLLWNPPSPDTIPTVLYLFLIAILVRTAISTNEVPSVAMVPELTRDYHERTAVIRYRYLLGWAGGLAMLMLAYGWLLAPPHGAPTGPLAPAGYRHFALLGAAIMFVSVVGSALGTHRRMARTPQTRIHEATLGETFRGIAHALSNRAFLVLMAAGIFAYVNQGISFAMSNYLLGFVWLFSPSDFLTYTIVLFAGVFAAFFMVTPIARALGKKGAAALLSVLSSIFATIPYWARLAGVFPKPGDAAMLPVFFVCLGLATGFGVCIMMLGGSMMADVVEASEERTGRRDEGLFYAGFLFMQKCTSGLGIFGASLIIAFAGLPAKAVPGQVAEDILDRAMIGFAGATIVIGAVSALIFTRFPFGRAEHEARLAKLAVAASGDIPEKGGNPQISGLADSDLG